MLNKLLSFPQKTRGFLSRMRNLYLIRSSGLFDEHWYLSQNPDVGKAKIDPLLHYLHSGGFEGRDPSPQFNSRWYLNTYQDVKQAGINPLVHYLQHGRKEGRKPYPNIAYSVTNTPNPILIHQMGKVGSKTVEFSLVKTFETTGIVVPIYHTHVLSGFESGKQLAFQEEKQRNPRSRLAALEHGERVRNLIDENPFQHWNVITMVRDPIARNVATFFHNLDEYIPTWRELYSAKQLNAQDVQEVFLKSTSEYKLLDLWFDTQLRAVPALGFDVYETPFPHKIGYKIYSSTTRASLLLIRLENLTRCVKSAMKEFLGIEKFVLQNTNEAGAKDYANLYTEFKNLSLPSEYVDEKYKTKLAQHFYSNAELDIFKKKWKRMKQ